MPNAKKSICVATECELKTPSYYSRLWLAARNAGIARRDWLDEIADALRDFDGPILQCSGLPYRVPDIDAVFGDDPDMRWLGYFLQATDTGDHPLCISRKLERLRMLDLYFKIKHPSIARHFGS